MKPFKPPGVECCEIVRAVRSSNCARTPGGSRRTRSGPSASRTRSASRGLPRPCPGSAEVPAVLRQDRDQLFADLLRQQLHLSKGKLLYIEWGMDAIEKTRIGLNGWNLPLDDTRPSKDAAITCGKHLPSYSQQRTCERPTQRRSRPFGILIPYDGSAEHQGDCQGMSITFMEMFQPTQVENYPTVPVL